MNLSVHMAPCNGEQYVQEPLSSVVMQMPLTNETVVSDGTLADATIRILQKFPFAGSFPVRVKANPASLSARRPFHRPLRPCSGPLDHMHGRRVSKKDREA